MKWVKDAAEMACDHRPTGQKQKRMTKKALE
jgi:hypothetical protein